MIRSAAIVLSVLALAGCASSGAHGTAAATPVGEATDDQRAALLDRVKSLQGTWEGTTAEGMAGEIEFKVTSGGHVVREIMFPGTDHEMTNIYHMDGATLVMTHYCAIGNQPRMRATAARGDAIELKFDSVSNLASESQMYMGQMTLVFVDKDTVEERWRSLVAGKASDHNAVFKLKRKK